MPLPRWSRSHPPRLEALEDRTLLAAWAGFAGDAQHTGLSAMPAEPLKAIRWESPVDLHPPEFGIHYGSPVITPANTVLVPTKTDLFNSFEVTAFDGTSGNAKWTLASDYLLAPNGFSGLMCNQ
jgi:hypothetical protein